jgi:hypothetical protein
MDVPAAVIFLQKRKAAAEAAVASLSEAIAALPDLNGDDAQGRMAQVADASMDFAVDELESWKEFLDEVRIKWLSSVWLDKHYWPLTNTDSQSFSVQGGLPTPYKLATAEALAIPVAASRRRSVQER